MRPPRRKEDCAVSQIAQALGMGPWTIRRMIWFLQIQPVRESWEWFTTKRGKRKALCKFYDQTAIAQIRQAMHERER